MQLSKQFVNLKQIFNEDNSKFLVKRRYFFYGALLENWRWVNRILHPFLSMDIFWGFLGARFQRYNWEKKP